MAAHERILDHNVPDSLSCCRQMTAWLTWATLYESCVYVQVMLYCLKHQWAMNPKMSMRLEIIERATELINELNADSDKAELDSGLSLPRFTIASALIHARGTQARSAGTSRGPSTWGLTTQVEVQEGLLAVESGEAPQSIIRISDLRIAHKPSLIAKAYFCLAQWKSQVAKELSQETADEINEVFELATQRAPAWGKLWHKQGIFNMLVLRDWIATNRRPLQDCTYIISTSVMAFFKSVTMHSRGSRHETLQVCILPHVPMHGAIASILGHSSTLQPFYARTFLLTCISHCLKRMLDRQRELLWGEWASLSYPDCLP